MRSKKADIGVDDSSRILYNLRDYIRLFAAEPFNIYAGELGDIRFAVDNGSKIGDGESLVGVEGKRFDSGEIQREFRTIFMINADDVGPRDFQLFAIAKTLG
jgi:hypothetical protein